MGQAKDGIMIYIMSVEFGIIMLHALNAYVSFTHRLYTSECQHTPRRVCSSAVREREISAQCCICLA